MHLAPDAVVLLFGPDLVGAHAFEHFVWSFDRAREHESNRLKQRDGAGLELTALAARGRLADVAGDQVEPLDLRDRYAESLGDRGVDQPRPRVRRRDGGNARPLMYTAARRRSSSVRVRK